MKQTNVSVFVPHYGCPNRCSFCNQTYISGINEPPSADEVRALLKAQQPHLAELGMTAEIAFFGGSFTAVSQDYMISLLEAASEYVKAFPAQYSGIRCSTRPDCISREILDILKEYGMTAIELGAQSMNDEVLAANDRGHTSADVKAAAKLIKEYGFSLGLQMMTGLYRDEPRFCRETAAEFAALGADTVRIYPTVILDGTRLGELYKSGEYRSFGFEETIDLCAELLTFFEEKKIPVIRLGLHASREVEEKMLGGVYHPALREIAESRIFLRRMEKVMKESGKKRFVVYTDTANISRVSGHKKQNRLLLAEAGFDFTIKTEKGTELRIVPLQ